MAQAEEKSLMREHDPRPDLTHPYYIYMLECADHTFYTGISTDPKKRLRAHNTGHGAKYTRSRRPCKMLACWEIGDKGEALHIEAAIKKLSRTKKAKLLQEELSSQQIKDFF